MKNPHGAMADYELGTDAAADSWVAIDFETASTRANPCSVGLACVEGGRVVERHAWLIRPPVFEFWDFNVAIHGITPEMCRDAPEWQESLDRILTIADGHSLVAHNASFDIGVIRDACNAEEVAWPRLRYACTLVIARRIWPGLSTYSLPFVVSHLGLPVGAHHDAGADAAMAAEIGLAALATAQVPTLADLAERARVSLGVLEPTEWSACHSRADALAIPRTPSPGAEISLDHPLFGKTVAFTGALAIPRRDAQQAVVNCGAVAADGVTRHTDYLVIGYQDMTRLAAGETKSHKLRHAEELQSAGFPVEIITENDFVHLVATAPEEMA